MHMRRAAKWVVVTLFSLAGFLAVAGRVGADVVIYSQPSDFPVTGRPGVYASQNDTAGGGFGNFATAYDNFSLAATSIVNAVSWQGGYFLPPVQGPISAFTLTFYADASGQPGAALLSETIPGTANETSVGTETATGNGGNLVFNYSDPLPVPFSAQAGTTYWLSIVPDLPFDQSDNPAFGQWGWHSGVGPDGTSVQDFFGDRLTRQDDLAFTLTGLTGAAVPEPASFLVWGLLGLVAVGWCKFGRRKIAA
jgi:hypothetical protein